MVTIAQFSRCIILLACSVSYAHSLAPPEQRAVVVGAGPVGIAAALTLASHHNFAVTILESSPASSAQTKYDPTKAFLYNVNARGQTLTKQFPNMHRKLVERSVPSSGFGAISLTVVPGDPDEALPEREEHLAGTSEEPPANNAKVDAGKALQSNEKAAAPGYWLPRHEMVNLMAECVEEHNARTNGNNKISLSFGRECVEIERTTTNDNDNGGGTTDADGLPRRCVRVTSRDSEDGSLAIHRAALVVGADGAKSRVRECLAAANRGAWQDGFHPAKFEPRRWTSPASHLRIKVLQFPAKFEIPDAPGRGPPLVTNSESIYALRAINTGPRNYLSLGLLPMKDDDAPRPTNVVTRPDHEVWEIKDGQTMRRYFQEAFPRFDFGEEGGLVSSEEWDRFAASEGTRYPHCQYSEGLAAWDPEGSCGVALTGDAAHAFPPDIGQGVNAGLMDVVSLDRALRGSDPETGEYTSDVPGEAEEEGSIGTSLEWYQRRHGPEIAALVRLARFGAPYQYKQPHRADRALRMLWTANVAARLILSKVTFGLVQPPAIILSQNEKFTFREVMRRADRTTALLKTILAAGLGLWAKQRYGFGFLKTMLA